MESDQSPAFACCVTLATDFISLILSNLVYKTGDHQSCLMGLWEALKGDQLPECGAWLGGGTQYGRAANIVFFLSPGFPPHGHRKVKWPSRVWLFATPWTVAYHSSPSMGFSRQEYWSVLPFPSPGDLPHPGIEPRSPALQADALLSEPPQGSHMAMNLI